MQFSEKILHQCGMWIYSTGAGTYYYGSSTVSQYSAGDECSSWLIGQKRRSVGRAVAALGALGRAGVGDRSIYSTLRRTRLRAAAQLCQKKKEKLSSLCTEHYYYS